LGATAGIARMLIDSGDGNLALLPALPSAWKEGRATGLRAKGGLTVDMEWKNGVVTTAMLRADKAQDLQVSARGTEGHRVVHLPAGVSTNLQF
jgi:alpha-L-fucosidase 2